MENRSSNSPAPDFKFAFKDTTFSDRVLRIEITSDSFDSPSDSDGRKRKREDLDPEIESSAVVGVKTLPISSLILAANSPFFYKLFKNGMRESKETANVTLRINASEEAALMDIVSFMYNNTLSATTSADLLGVLIVADKFEVPSCVKHCTDQLLGHGNMSQESALLYLELQSSFFVGKVVQPLIDAAKQYLVARHRNLFDSITSLKDIMALPLCAIEVILGSDGLRVSTEDDVFYFVLRWARAHYPILEERREILTKRLARLIHFPYMSSSKLKEVLVCPDFDQEEVSKLVLKALLGRFEGASTDLDPKNCGFKPREYWIRPVKVVQFELPRRPHCVVYFDLRKDECADTLQQRGTLISVSFNIGGQKFHLAAECAKDVQQNSMHPHFGLYVCSLQRFTACTLDYEFAVMKSSSLEFRIMHKVNNHHLMVTDVLKSVVTKLGVANLFGIPWNNFIADDSEYFIDGILHLRVRLTINNY